jgi:hypothetical protein
MLLRRFALVAGLVYLVVGILGFVPGLVQPPHAPRELAVDAGYGNLLGLFPINVVHNVVHLLIGAWGVAAWRSHAGALGFARGLAVIYGLLTVLGLIPATETLFGLAPLYGHDVWLHAATALVAAYFGFGPPARRR